MKKIVLIIIDGLGDRPIPEFKGKTPLESAKTPNLNWLAENGVCGLVDPFFFDWQKYPRSDSSHLSIFGYNPRKDYLGRGPYEAAGIDMKMKKRDIVMRSNFGTVDKKFKIVDRRANRIKDTSVLVKTLSGIKIDGIKFLMGNSLQHRAVLIMRGKGLSADLKGGDNKKKGIIARKIFAKNKKAQFTANVLNKFILEAHNILKEHPLNKKRIKKGLLPGNYLLVRGFGQMRKIVSFDKKHKLKSACIAGGDLYKGVARILGMKYIPVKGANGSANTNLEGKVLAVKKNLKKYSFIFCHIKATDIFGEDGDFVGKKAFIEKIDKRLKPLLKIKNTILVVTSDHCTPCELKNHSKDLIPILIYGNGKDAVDEFSEKACSKGKLKKIKQVNIMKKILSIAKE